MRKTITYEVDDNTYELYLRPKVKRKQLSKLVSQFFELYASSVEVRDYFENIDKQNEARQISELENIISNKDFLRRIGVLDAEIEDLEAHSKNAKRQGMSGAGNDDTFSFEDEDEPAPSKLNPEYATKADISRIESTMTEILEALKTGNVQMSNNSNNFSHQSNVPMRAEDIGMGEEADEDDVDMLDAMFSFE